MDQNDYVALYLHHQRERELSRELLRRQMVAERLTDDLEVVRVRGRIRALIAHAGSRFQAASAHGPVHGRVVP